MISQNINNNILTLLERESAFFDSFDHGLNHWRMVERNGLYLSQFTGADTKVVSIFAYFHDCMRENEYEDPKHGPRGAAFAKQHSPILGLSDTQLQMLYRACRGHTYGKKSVCCTIATCWDADRLDIGRVGITPNAKYMLTDEAKRIAKEQDFSVLGT